jgi:hypothetical protein
METRIAASCLIGPCPTCSKLKTSEGRGAPIPQTLNPPTAISTPATHHSHALASINRVSTVNPAASYNLILTSVLCVQTMCGENRLYGCGSPGDTTLDATGKSLHCLLSPGSQGECVLRQHFEVAPSGTNSTDTARTRPSTCQIGPRASDRYTAWREWPGRASTHR